MLPCVMFTFSIAPLTTAWTPGRCGFIGCITRTRANGEKAHACSGGVPVAWLGGGRLTSGSRQVPPPHGGEGAAFPSFLEQGAQPEERGALLVMSFSHGLRALS